MRLPGRHRSNRRFNFHLCGFKIDGQFQTRPVKTEKLRGVPNCPARWFCRCIGRQFRPGFKSSNLIRGDPLKFPWGSKIKLQFEKWIGRIVLTDINDQVIGFIQVPEQLFQSATGRIVDHLASDLNRRFQHKPAKGHARMRNGQVFRLDIELIKENQIQVNFARPPTLVPDTSKL